MIDLILKIQGYDAFHVTCIHPLDKRPTLLRSFESNRSTGVSKDIRMERISCGHSLIRSYVIHVFTDGEISYTLCSDNSNGQVISLI